MDTSTFNRRYLERITDDGNTILDILIDSINFDDLMSKYI